MESHVIKKWDFFKTAATECQTQDQVLPNFEPCAATEATQP